VTASRSVSPIKRVAVQGAKLSLACDTSSSYQAKKELMSTDKYFYPAQLGD